MTTSDLWWVFGQPAPPPTPLLLHAGPLSLVWEAPSAFLRQVFLGSTEVLRGIYPAIRDRHWNTIPPELRILRQDIESDRFVIAFEAVHRLGSIEFAWRGHVRGTSDGSLEYEFDGEAITTFLRNRIGLCLLHPIRPCAGRTCLARYIDGSSSQLTFPIQVATEQPVPGFTNLASLTHEVEPGLLAEVTFEGDLFETEDQRNWIDASFKTYSTPLRLPFPVEIRPGTRIRQAIRLRLVRVTGPQTAPWVETPQSHRRPPSAEPICLSLPAEPDLHRLPDLGLQHAAGEPPLTPADVDRFSALQLSHLRVDVTLADANWPAILHRATRQANELGLSLELAIHLRAIHSPDFSDYQLLTNVRRELSRWRADVTRILVLQDGQKSTPAPALAAARECLGDLCAPLGAGTAADLYQLHLQPPPAGADFLCWSMNPQVHVTDHRSILETPEAAGDQVRTVAARYPGMPLVVSPVTLKPRFNPVADRGGPDTDPARSATIDPRQFSLFTAAWSLTLLADLTAAGVESVTFFETIGARGVLSGHPQDADSDPPASSSPRASAVYQVFRALAGYRHASTLSSSARNQPTALLLRGPLLPDCMVIANARLHAADLPLAPPLDTWRLRHLDPPAVREAASDPDTFWRQPAVAAGPRLRLAPLELAILIGARPGSHPPDSL